MVEDLRVEAACSHLEISETEIKEVAHICGFADEERMRRAFLRRLGVPPAAHRDRFGNGGSRTERAYDRLGADTDPHGFDDALRPTSARPDL
jgi:AraC-like DNA-binding protein